MYVRRGDGRSRGLADHARRVTQTTDSLGATSARPPRRWQRQISES
jgi:hypothetical protein